MTEFEPLNVNQTIQETLRILHSESVIQGLTFHQDLTDTLPDVFGNKVQLQQVLLNLFRNASQAMQQTAKENRSISVITSRANESEVQVQVEDTGPGINPEKIGTVIGPGGKTIKGIVDQTGCSVDVEDDGTVSVASSDAEAVKRALDIIAGLTAEPEVGQTYTGTVRRIVDFGAFVEILPNTEALLHVSEIAHERVERVEDVLAEGDEVEVKVISADRDGKIRLSRRELLPFPEGREGEQARERIARAREGGSPQRSGGRGRDRNDRGGGRGRDRGPRSRSR